MDGFRCYDCWQIVDTWDRLPPLEHPRQPYLCRDILGEKNDCHDGKKRTVVEKVNTVVCDGVVSQSSRLAGMATPRFPVRVRSLFRQVLL